MDTQTDAMTMTGPSRASLLRRLAEGCYRRRRFVLAGWLLIVIGLSAVAGAAAGEFDNEFGLPGSEAQEAFDRLEKSGFGDRAGATIQLVVEAEAGVEGRAHRPADRPASTRLRGQDPPGDRRSQRHPRRR